MQVAAWFVAGVAWPMVLVCCMFLLEIFAGPRTKDSAWSAMFWVAVGCVSSGVAVAATAVALGVGR